MSDDIFLEKAIEEFNIIDFLEKQSVDFSLSGKNIGKNWIGINPCINENCGDERYHCAIHRENKNCTCFVCGYKTNIVGFVAKILKCNYEESKEVILTNSSYFDKIDNLEYKIKNILSFEKKSSKETFEKHDLKLPKSTLLNQTHLQYEIIYNCFKKRNLNIFEAQSYKLRLSLEHKYKNCLILPIFINKQLIAYQYISMGQKFYKSEGKIHHYFYNQDKLKQGDTIILVEGFWDYHNLKKFILKNKKPYKVTTPFTKNLTTEQINFINKLEPKKVIFFWDYDSWFQYHKPSQKIICNTDFLIAPSNKDPGGMTEEQFFVLFEENKL